MANDNATVNALLSLIQATKAPATSAVTPQINPMDALFADVGLSDELMDTELVSSGVEEADLQLVLEAINRAVDNNDVATLNKIMKSGAKVLGFLKDVLL